MNTKLPHVGERLPNGATVIASRDDGRGEDSCVVLCFTHWEDFQPYVVWRCRLSDRVCVSGDYHIDIDVAAHMYVDR